MNFFKGFSLVFFVLLFGWIFARPMKIHGDCMEPAVKNGQISFVNQLAPRVRGQKTGDIITFKHEGKAWFSRVVALAGDTIEINDGQVLVNGIELKDGSKRDWKDWKQGVHGVGQPFKIPVGHVFVLSDRLGADHDDSRHFGPIKKSEITGLIWFLI